MTERKFYKTTITVVVLTEDLLEGSPLELSTIVSECDEGAFVSHSEYRKSEEVTAEQMANLLKEAGSEPDFFQIEEGA